LSEGNKGLCSIDDLNRNCDWCCFNSKSCN